MFNYFEDVRNTIIDYFETVHSESPEITIEYNDIHSIDDLSEYIDLDDLTDYVTGIKDGSFTYDKEKARSNLRGNENLYVSLMDENDMNEDDRGFFCEAFLYEPEKADVFVRYSILDKILWDFIDEQQHKEQGVLE